MLIAYELKIYPNFYLSLPTNLTQSKRKTAERKILSLTSRTELNDKHELILHLQWVLLLILLIKNKVLILSGR